MPVSHQLAWLSGPEAALSPGIASELCGLADGFDEAHGVEAGSVCRQADRTPSCDPRPMGRPSCLWRGVWRGVAWRKFAFRMGGAPPSQEVGPGHGDPKLDQMIDLWVEAMNKF